MNTSVKMILVLTLISALSGGLLSYWDAYTSEKIEAYRQQEIQQAIKEVLPDTDEEKIQEAGDLPSMSAIKTVTSQAWPLSPKAAVFRILSHSW